MRTLFEPEHEAFRDSFAAFVAKEMVPDFPQWEIDGIVPREVFRRAGKFGFLGMSVPEQYGGGGVTDFRFNQVIGEEGAAAGIAGAIAAITLHNDVCTPYFTEYCTPEQAERWLPGIASGELITAIAMTEPGTGSDLAGITTSAVRDGDEYVLNGSKTFITNGINSDLVIVVARTDPGGARHAGMSLLVVERGMEGFERGRNLEKIGQHSQDTAELFFSDVRVPAANLLGEQGKAFAHLTHNLAQERTSIALYGVAAARAAVRWTLDYVSARTAFGTSIGSFQNTKFVLADCQTEVDVTQAFVDQCVMALVRGELDASEAAKAKLWATQVQQRVIDRCLQLFGGYGYTVEYPISRAYVDARVTSIYGGTSEVMRSIVAKSIGL